MSDHANTSPPNNKAPRKTLAYLGLTALAFNILLIVVLILAGGRTGITFVPLFSLVGIAILIFTVVMFISAKRR